MGRVRRLTYAGAYYHVICRGINKRNIFLDVKDYDFYLHKVEKYSEEYVADILAFSLIPNHIHLQIHTPEDTLSQMMKPLNSSYATYFNRKYDRTGSLFQDRFKSIIVDKNEYLLELNRYIHLQALKAEIVQNLGDYPWSSYREYIGSSNQFPWVKKDTVLSQFRNIREFISFTKEGLRGKLLVVTRVKIGYFYVNQDFVERIGERLDNRRRPKKAKGRRKGEWHKTPLFSEKKIINGTLSYYGIKRITNINSYSDKESSRIRKVLIYLLKKYAQLNRNYY